MAPEGGGPNFFLLKSEPHEFCIRDLEKCGAEGEEWDGVRNFQARNILRTMKVGDRAFFYHSNCKEPAIVGKVRVVREVQPDKTALDPKHPRYDPKSTADKCRWDSVLVKLDRIYPVPVTLRELKELAKNCDEKVIGGMSLFKNSRLSVQSVSREQWEAIEALAMSREGKICRDGNNESPAAEPKAKKKHKTAS